MLYAMDSILNQRHLQTILSELKDNFTTFQPIFICLVVTNVHDKIAQFLSTWSVSLRRAVGSSETCLPVTSSVGNPS